MVNFKFDVVGNYKPPFISYGFNSHSAEFAVHASYVARNNKEMRSLAEEDYLHIIDFTVTETDSPIDSRIFA